MHLSHDPCTVEIKVLLMSFEIKKLLFTAEELSAKIRFGRDAIEKARAQGKEVGQWEEIIEQMEQQRENLLDEIANLLSEDIPD